MNPHVRSATNSGTKADMPGSPSWAITGREQSQQTTLTRLPRRRKRETWAEHKSERLGGPKVHDELKFGRAHHRQIGGLFAVENASGIDANLAIRIGYVGPIANQSTRRDSLAPRIDHRQSALGQISTALD